MATFGLRLKELRKERGIRQTDLADILGVTKDTVAKWEQNVRRPEFSTLENLCSEFDVTLGWLMGEDVERTPEEPSDEFLAESALEDEADVLNNMVKLLCRLNQQSRGIVQATLNAVYQLDKAKKQLEPENQFNVSITANLESLHEDEDKNN